MRTLIAALLVAASVSPAAAVSAGDFLDKMNEQQRFGYMNGALDAITYDLARAGQGDKAQCVASFYYEGSGPQDLAALLESHPELPVVGILKALIKRNCP